MADAEVSELTRQEKRGKIEIKQPRNGESLECLVDFIISTLRSDLILRGIKPSRKPLGDRSLEITKLDGTLGMIRSTSP